MTIGVRRTLNMMYGELLGVALVAIFAVVGVANIMLNHPNAFLVLKYGGGAYLIYSGIKMWQSKGKLAIDLTADNNLSGRKLALQGFITAIANPKGWAFAVSLFPSFINPDLDMVPQLSSLVMIFLVSEFIFLMLYANGGKVLRRILEQADKVQLINRISGSLMILVGIWLALD
jgi:threonine/homoserine/homoserine lactone efflux protein